MNDDCVVTGLDRRDAERDELMNLRRENTALREEITGLRAALENAVASHMAVQERMAATEVNYE